jgi:hypothetical protein
VQWALGTSLAVVLLSACGGGSSSSSAGADTTTTTTAITGDATAFQDCLKEHGVDLPEGGFPVSPSGASGPRPSGPPPSLPSGGSGPSGSFPGQTAEQREAFQACADLAPEGGFGGRGGANGAAFDAYRSCLGDHGVDTSNAEPGGGQSLRDDPKFAEADAACAPLRPTPDASMPTTTEQEK